MEREDPCKANSNMVSLTQIYHLLHQNNMIILLNN